MKKIFLNTTGFLAATVILLSSCNKKDIEELQSDVDSQNGNIENLQNVISSDGGLTGSITGNRGSDSVAFSSNYSHMYVPGTGNDYSYIEDNGDGTYDIYIERYKNTNGNEYSYIEIEDYDPSTGIDNSETYVYLEHDMPANDIQSTLQFWQEGYNHCCGNQLTFNSFSINTTTKEISFSLTMKSVDDDGYNSTDNPTTVTMNYSGTLSWENTTYRKAKN